jgi:UDP-glucuronate 4-epimerase
VGCLDHPADGRCPRILNIGNHRSEEVRRFVVLLEEALGRRAVVVDTPRPATDVEETFADIAAIQAICGFVPGTSIEDGIPRFAEWYLSWRKGG